MKGRGAEKDQKKKTSGFIMAVRYRNDLPRPPTDLKFIKIPSRPDKLFNYHISTLEQRYKYRVHLEPNVGQPIHLIDPSTADDRSARLSPEDKHLLRREQDEVQDLYARSGGASGSSGNAPLSAFGNSMSARNIADGVHLRLGKHWLRKTVYMDNLQHGSIHNYATGLAENQKRLENVEREQRLLHGNSSRLTKGERIEQSFKLAKETPVHQTKKELKPVKVLSLLPSFELSQHMLYAVQFLDDNVLDDELLDQSQLDPKGRVVHKRGRQILEYTPAQVRTLESGVLEQVNREAVNQISFLVPGAPPANNGGKGPGAPDEADEADSDFGEDSDEDELTRKPTQASSSTKGANGDQEYLKWIRDYSYKTTTFKPCERFGMVWKRSTVEAPGDVNNVLYDSVRFVELAGARIDCTRTQTDEWDIEGSRSKRIKVDRRALTAEEHDTVTNRLRDIQEVDITSGDSQQDDEDEAEEEKKQQQKQKQQQQQQQQEKQQHKEPKEQQQRAEAAKPAPKAAHKQEPAKEAPAKPAPKRAAAASSDSEQESEAELGGSKAPASSGAGKPQAKKSKKSVTDDSESSGSEF